MGIIISFEKVNEITAIIDNVIDAWIEAGNGVTAMDFHKAAEELFSARNALAISTKERPDILHIEKADVTVSAMSEPHRKCDYADERDKSGYCAHKRCRCDGCGDLFVGNPYYNEVHVVDRKDICKKSSIFGNYYINLTAEDIAKLQDGECLAATEEEYCIFLSFGVPQEGGGTGDGG